MRRQRLRIGRLEDSLSASAYYLSEDSAAQLKGPPGPPKEPDARSAKVACDFPEQDVVPSGLSVTSIELTGEAGWLLSSVLDASNEGIVSVDLGGCITSWNPSAARLFGYSYEEAIGRSVITLVPPNRIDRFQYLIHEAAEGRYVGRHAMIGLTKAGREIGLSAAVSPVRDASGKAIAVVVIVDDASPMGYSRWAPFGAREVDQRRSEARNDELTRVNTQLLALAETEHEERLVAELLADASRAMSQTLSVQSVFEVLLDYLARLAPYDSAEILLWEGPERLAVAAVRGHTWAEPEELMAKTVDAETQPVVGQALGNRARGILVPDTSSHPQWHHPLGAEQVSSWLGVPLVAGDKVIGLCGLDGDTVGRFTPEHLRLAEALVGQAAIALQNAWLFDQVRAGRERLRSLTRRLVEIQESERRYVARELHDQAGQALASLMVGLRLLERDAHRPEAVLVGVADLRQIADGVLEELHRLSMDLRPASLDHLGLVAALQQHAEAVGDRHDLMIRFKVLGFDQRLSLDVETALYRIGQEALTNVVRHAQATRVDILLVQDRDMLRLIIEDNGVGFDPTILDHRDRLGVFGMREWAEMLGGTLMVDSAVGAGTIIQVEVPYGSTDSHR